LLAFLCENGVSLRTGVREGLVGVRGGGGGGLVFGLVCFIGVCGVGGFG